MTLTHIVLVKTVDGATDEQLDEVVAALAALPAQIPEIRSYSVGRDRGLLPGNWDMAVTGTFDSPEDFGAYVAHPAHQRVVRQHLDPVSAQRIRVQFDSPMPVSEC